MKLDFTVQFEDFEFIQIEDNIKQNTNKELIKLSHKSRVYLNIVFIQPNERSFDLICKTPEKLTDVVINKNSLRWCWNSSNDIYNAVLSTENPNGLTTKYLIIKAYKKQLHGLIESKLLGVLPIDLYTLITGPRNIEAFTSQNHKIKLKCTCLQIIPYYDISWQSLVVHNIADKQQVLNINNTNIDIVYLDTFNNQKVIASKIPIDSLQNRISISECGKVEDIRISRLSAEEFRMSGFVILLYNYEHLFGYSIIPTCHLFQPMVAPNIYSSFIMPVFLLDVQNKNNSNNNLVVTQDYHILLEGVVQISQMPSFYQMINSEALLTKDGVYLGEFTFGYPLPLNICANATLTRRSFQDVYQQLAVQTHRCIIANNESKNSTETLNLSTEIIIFKLVQWYQYLYSESESNIEEFNREESNREKSNPFNTTNKIKLLVLAYQEYLQLLQVKHEQELLTLQLLQQSKLNNLYMDTAHDFNLLFNQHKSEYNCIVEELDQNIVQLKLQCGQMIAPISITEQ